GARSSRPADCGCADRGRVRRCRSTGSKSSTRECRWLGISCWRTVSRWVFPVHSTPRRWRRCWVWRAGCDAPVERVAGGVPVPRGGGLQEGHQRPGGAGRGGAGARSVQRAAVRVLQPCARPGADPVLGAKRFLPVAKAPGEAPLSLAAPGVGGGGDTHGAAAELAAGRARRAANAAARAALLPARKLALSATLS